MVTKSMSKTKVESLIRSIPKTEIHLHLEGLASADTIWDLKVKNHLSFPGIESKDDLVKKFQVNSLDEFIDLFINVIQNCFQEEQDIAKLVDDAESYLVRNNVGYAEIFFAPSKFVRNGFNYSHIVNYLHEGALKLKEERGIEIKYLMDVSRSFGMDNAMHNLDLTLQYPKDTIIGIGLGGAESKGPAVEYKDVFEKARKEGLHVVAHAGEDVGPESIWSALQDLHIERIGHGISAIEDPALMDELARSRIPLEVCPTSNLFTKKYVSTYKEHMIRPFYDHGMVVTLNTDDPTIFGVELIEEYMNMYNNDLFTLPEIFELMKNNIYATFLPKEEQDILWNKASKVIEAEEQ